VQVQRNDAEDADLARFARAMRTRVVVGAALGAMVRTTCVLALPMLALLWLWPHRWLVALLVVATASAVRAAHAALRARRQDDHTLLQAAAVPGVDAVALAELGDELATWLERRPAAAAPMRAWLAQDVRQKLPNLPAATVRRVGRPRIGRVLWLLPLALLLVLAFLFTDLLSPPWRGVLGGRVTGSVPQLPDPQAVAERLLDEVRAYRRDPLRGLPGLPRLDDGDRLDPTLTLATDADGLPVPPGHERSGNVQHDGAWALARRIRVERIDKPDYHGWLATVSVFGREADGSHAERARAFELFDEPPGDAGGNGAARQPQPRDAQQPDATPPPSAGNEPEPPPPADGTPPPLLDLPSLRQFLLPEFVGDGPTQRVRMHAAETSDAPTAPTPQNSSAAAGTPPPPPSRETFERAAEAAQRARHVPPAERAIVRAFFDALREAAK
jgi:hypothetical protein